MNPNKSFIFYNCKIYFSSKKILERLYFVGQKYHLIEENVGGSEYLPKFLNGTREATALLPENFTDEQYLNEVKAMLGLQQRLLFYLQLNKFSNLVIQNFSYTLIYYKVLFLQVHVHKVLFSFSFYKIFFYLFSDEVMFQCILSSILAKSNRLGSNF